jgi:hypothetical protein
MCKFTTSTIAAALVAVVAGLSTPAAARQPKSEAECKSKFDACQQRCANKGGDWTACINRTCIPQHENCIDSIRLPRGGGSAALPKPRPPRIGHGPFSPVSAGSANSIPGAPDRGPFDDVGNSRPNRPGVLLGNGGLFDNGPSFGSQGPAATGTPRAPAPPPAPPPVIIR